MVGGATVPSGAFCDGPCARPRANAWSEIYRRLEDPTESASAAYRRAGTRTRRETSPCAPQCKPVEVGRRDGLPRRARLRRLLRALRRVHEGTTDGARRRTSSRRTYFDRGLALKARSETMAGEFASMTAVPTISGCCGGRPRLPQHLRREARDPGTRRRAATRRRFRGRFGAGQSRGRAVATRSATTSAHGRPRRIRAHLKVNYGAWGAPEASWTGTGSVPSPAGLCLNGNLPPSP